MCEAPPGGSCDWVITRRRYALAVLPGVDVPEDDAADQRRGLLHQFDVRGVGVRGDDPVFFHEDAAFGQGLREGFAPDLHASWLCQ